MTPRPLVAFTTSISRPISPRVVIVASIVVRMGVLLHVGDLALAVGEVLQDRADAFLGHLDPEGLVGLEQHGRSSSS